MRMTVSVAVCAFLVLAMAAAAFGAGEPAVTGCHPDAAARSSPRALPVAEARAEMLPFNVWVVAYESCVYDSERAADFGVEPFSRFVMATYTYDRLGYLIDETIHGIRGVPASQCVYRRGADGEILEVRHLADDGSLTGTETAEYSCTDGGAIVLKRTLKDPAGKAMEWTIISHDGDGREVSRELYAGDGALLRTYLTAYDGRGKRESVSEYDADGVLCSETVWQYDLLRGTLLMEVTVDPAGTFMASYEPDYSGGWSVRKVFRAKPDGSSGLTWEPYETVYRTVDSYG